MYRLSTTKQNYDKKLIYTTTYFGLLGQASKGYIVYDNRSQRRILYN